jgi:neutral ceramidase
VGGTLYSADYPRYLQDQLRSIHGEQFVSLFAESTCGDINHVDTSKPAGEGRRKTEPIGTMLAETVAAKIADLAAIGQPSLAVRSGRVDAQLQSYTPEEIAAARRDMEKVDSRELSFIRRVEAYKIMALELLDGPTIPLEVQAFRLSDSLAIVTLPGEVFVELGLAIKRASPFETTVLVELCNDGPGYIPTQKAFAEGSYETVNSRVVPGSGEAMVALAVELLNDLASE